MKRLIVLLGLPLLVGMCIVTAGCNADKNGTENAIPTSIPPSNSVIYFMAGKIDANEKVDISSKITARITSITGDVGSIVKKGDTLIQLDAKDLAAQKAQAQAGVYQVQAAIDKAQVSCGNAQNINDRNQELFNVGAISKSQLEQSQAELAAAKSTLQAAQAQSDQAQAALDLASTQLGNSTIVSPISGVISAKKANTGELAVSGATLLTVVNADTLTINAYLPASQINKIEIGQDVAIKVSEIPNIVFEGKIFVIDSVINSKAGNVLVKVQFSEQDPLIKPGMFAEIGLLN